MLIQHIIRKLKCGSPLLNILNRSLRPTIQKVQYSKSQALYHAKSSTQTSTDQTDLANFNKLSKTWWNLEGDVKLLHVFNTIRVPFIREGLIATDLVDPRLINTPNVLQNLNILEIGCGGGILSEALARLGANITGIDINETLINVAKEHICQYPKLTSRINYQLTSLEDFHIDHVDKFDAVVLSEVIEHVNMVDKFLEMAVKTLKPGGSIFITTINKTMASWLGAIVLAEYVMKLVPQNTHQWEKFISPTEVQRILGNCGCSTNLVNGVFYNPITNSFSIINSTDVQYVLQAVKL